MTEIQPFLGLFVAGQVKEGFFPNNNELYCKYCFAYGSDWEIVTGMEDGITQIAQKNNDGMQICTWNLPVDIAFKSTSPFGWPQFIIEVYGLDTFNNDVIVGYGLHHIPASSGFHKIKINTFTPQSSSFINKITSWLTGHKPEYLDVKFLTQGEKREVTKVKSEGYIIVEFNIVTKDFMKLGYQTNTQTENVCF